MPACGFRSPTQMGQGAVAGVGGTRLCDWWFTEDAVLIDTAGRYTTQDSECRGGSCRLGAFLDLLKRTRPRQPLNGVIVAFPLSDIAQAPAARARGACASDPSPHRGAGDAARCADAGLRAVHQGGSDRRLHRVLRRPRSREARAGLGHDICAGRRRRQGLSQPSPRSSTPSWSG